MHFFCHFEKALSRTKSRDSLIMESGCRQNCEYYSYDLVKMSKWMNSDPEYLGG